MFVYVSQSQTKASCEAVKTLQENTRSAVRVSDAGSSARVSKVRFEGRQVNCACKRAAPQAPAEKCERRADGRKGRKKSDRRGVDAFSPQKPGPEQTASMRWARKTAVIPTVAVCVATTTVYHNREQGMQRFSTVEDIKV